MPINKIFIKGVEQPPPDFIFNWWLGFHTFKTARWKQLLVRLPAVVCPFWSLLYTFFAPSVMKGQLRVLQIHSCAIPSNSWCHLVQIKPLLSEYEQACVSRDSASHALPVPDAAHWRPGCLIHPSSLGRHFATPRGSRRLFVSKAFFLEQRPTSPAVARALTEAWVRTMKQSAFYPATNNDF